MTKLIIIRHCETIFNSQGKMQGFHQDSEFTPEGKRQIDKLIERLKNDDIKAVFCSDLGRAFKTAEAIAKSHNLSTVKIKDLRECDIGDWKDMPPKESIAKWEVFYKEQKSRGLKRESIRPPNGENSFDHQKRVMHCVNQIIEDYPKEAVVIVGHSGTNKVIIGSLQNKDPDDFYEIKQSNACINIIETGKSGTKVICINDVSHLI